MKMQVLMNQFQLINHMHVPCVVFLSKKRTQRQVRECDSATFTLRKLSLYKYSRSIQWDYWLNDGFETQISLQQVLQLEFTNSCQKSPGLSLPFCFELKLKVHATTHILANSKLSRWGLLFHECNSKQYVPLISSLQ